MKLAESEVHIWHIPLSARDGAIQRLAGALSVDEIQRADRFHFEKHRRRFVIARAAMRQILGQYVHIAPQNLVFAYSSKGKPELAPGFEGTGIRFNLSHSNEFAVLAIAERRCLGIDVEWVNHEFAADDIAERFFSANEVRTFRSLPPGERDRGVL